MRFPPGRLAIRLDERQRRAYRELHAHYRTFLEGLPLLRERDLEEGRTVTVTRAQLDALNRAFAALAEEAPARIGAAFEAQERAKNRLFKRLQYLS